MQASAIKNEVALRVFMGPQRYSWHSPPRLNVTVEVGRPLHWHRITLLGRLTHSCSRGYQSWCPKTFHKHRRSNEHEVKNFAFTPGVVDEIGGLWMRSRMLASPWFTIQSTAAARIAYCTFPSAFAHVHRKSKAVEFLLHWPLKQQVLLCHPQVP